METPRFGRSVNPARALFLSVVCCAAAGCSSADRKPARDTVVSIVEDLRLDASREDFSQLGRLIVGNKGEIIIGMPQDRQIRVYDSTGKRIATTGRKGEAPGEFQYVGWLGLKADTFWVQDAASRHISYYTPAGEFLRRDDPLPAGLSRTSVLTPVQGFRWVITIGAHTDGSFLATARQVASTNGGNGFSAEAVVNISPDGNIRKVGELPSSDDPRWMMQVSNLGRAIPFAGSPLGAFSRDASRFGYVETNIHGNEGTYRVAIFRASGDTIFVREYPFVGVPIPQTVRDSAANAEIQDEPPTEGPSDLDQRFKRLALEKMPQVYAPIQSLLLGNDETTWLALRDSSGLRRYIVLDDRGEQLGMITLSTRSRIRQATSRNIWVTELDDSDLASVVRYKVTGLSFGRKE